jgi:DNA-directed RNA polymerase specialized sigma24 family protein
MTPPEFADLLARARLGDKEALTALLTTLHDRLHTAAHRDLGGAPHGGIDAQDVVQSAQKSLLICLRKGKYDFTDEDKLTGLAMRILQRKVFQRFRRAKKDREIRDTLARQAGARAESTDDAARALENQERKERVESILKLMSKTQRELAERVMDGQTIAAAARALGLTPQYARVIWGRMRTELHEIFPDSFPLS